MGFLVRRLVGIGRSSTWESKSTLQRHSESCIIRRFSHAKVPSLNKSAEHLTILVLVSWRGGVTYREIPHAKKFKGLLNSQSLPVALRSYSHALMRNMVRVQAGRSTLQASISGQLIAEA